MLGYASERAVLSHHCSGQIFLKQDLDGQFKTPRIDELMSMIANGEARQVQPSNMESPTEKLQVEINLLDANKVPQGDKAIWIFLTKHWTPELIARFGPHDDPWRIRRWRADLRKAKRQQSASR